MSSLRDRISTLPDGVLQDIISFLPADEAVQTSVLARRWRHQWRFMPCLRITSNHVWEMEDSHVKEFVNNVLLLRDPKAALDYVFLNYNPSENDGRYANTCIRHALLCQTKVLDVELLPEGMYLQLDGPPLISNHLTTLELTFLDLQDDFLDFSRCPSLKYLRILECILRTSRILSQSIEYLSIINSAFYNDTRTCVTAPSLVTLRLEVCHGKTAPLLESMTELKTAIVSLGLMDADRCEKGDSGECCGTCAKCCGNDDHNIGCMLLGGLSSATYLNLTTILPGEISFRRELLWCPIFAKLKTLWLGDWCVEADLRALVCMLEHSPVLKNLTLELRKGPARTLEREENYGLMEESASISEHLQTVKVKCKEVDDRVYKILKFFSKFDVEITVKRKGQIKFSGFCLKMGC